MNSTVQTIKIADLIVQSILFILFALSVNDEKYGTVLLLVLVSLQLVSCFVNLLLKYKKKKSKPRIAYIIVGFSYLALFMYYLKNGIKEIYINDMAGEGNWKIPVTEIIIMTIGIVITLMYFIICFSEVKSSLKKLR